MWRRRVGEGGRSWTANPDYKVREGENSGELCRDLQMWFDLIFKNSYTTCQEFVKQPLVSGKRARF